METKLIPCLLTFLLIMSACIVTPAGAVKTEDPILEDINSNLVDASDVSQARGMQCDNPHTKLVKNPHSRLLSAIIFIPYVKDIQDIGCVDGIEVTHMELVVGRGEWDVENIYRYKSCKTTDKAISLYPGQCLTHVFYEKMAVFFAKNGYDVYVIERRETNVPLGTQDFSDMESWDIDLSARDYYYGNIVARTYTGLENGIKPSKVRLVILGHSLGATIATYYEASIFDESFLGNADQVVAVETVIKFNSSETELIARQSAQCDYISFLIENGTYQTSNMEGMIGIAHLAYFYSDDICQMQPIPGYELTNRQVFRLAAGATHANMMFPYTDNYHYWTMDPQFMMFAPLSYVDEDELLLNVLNGGAVPYSSQKLDLFMSSLMADETEIDSGKFDSPALYFGITGGFGAYGEEWFEEAGADVLIWETDQGHGAIAMDENSYEMWEEIFDWMNNN